MATRLTAPIPRDAITDQHIESVVFRIARKRSADGTRVVIDRSRTSVTYQVETLDESGAVISRAARTVLAANWPAPFTSTARDMLGMIEQDARANGLLEAGTDEQL